MKQTRILTTAIATLSFTTGITQAQFVDVSGAGVIGDTVLTTSAGTAVWPTYNSWRVNGSTGQTFCTLKTPAVAVTADGNVTLTFSHRYNFTDAENDGGAVYISVDGGASVYLPLSAFTSNGYNAVGKPAGFGSAWTDTPIFSSSSSGFIKPQYITTVANLGSYTTGQMISVEFVAKWDNSIPGTNPPSWEFGSVKLTDSAVVPVDILNADLNTSNSSFTQTSGNHSAGTTPPSNIWNYAIANTSLNRFEINGDDFTSDNYATDVPVAINLANARIEVVLLTGTLDLNDTFTLFNLSNGSTITGTPAYINLPVVSGVVWDVSQLGVDGTIKVKQTAAADGAWKDVTGNWWDAVNWSTTTVAYGADQTASLTANITGNRTISLDRDTTVGNITKADATPTDNTLTIASAAPITLPASIPTTTLTLDTTSGSPVITNSDTASGARRLDITCPIAGSDGLTKNGPGVVRFTNISSIYTGVTSINGGLLDFGDIPNTNIGGGAGAGRNITVATGASVRFGGLDNAFLNRIVETSAEIGVFTGPGGVTTFNTSNLDFSSITGANLPNAFLGCFTTNNSPTIYSGVLTPASDNYRLGYAGSSGFLGMTNALSGTQGLLVGASPVVLTGNNTFTGDTVLNTAGRLFIGQNLALQNSVLDTTNGALSLHNTPGTNNCPGAALADQPVLGGLKGNKNFTAMLSTANQNNTTSLAAVFVKGLTLNPGTGKTPAYTGAISEMAPGTYITKTGQGSQTLSGADTHTGITSVNEGTLVIGNAKALGTGGPAANTTGQTNVATGATLDLNGMTSVNEPITLSGDGMGGNGALVNNSVSPASVTNGVASLALPTASTGSGYSGALPTVTISGTGSGATATATRGVTTASFVVNASGNRVYTVAPIVTIGGGGTGAGGATAVPILSGGTTGTVTGLTITAPGYGFNTTTVPSATVSGGTSTGSTTTTFTGNALNFTIAGVSLTASGSGYTGTPTYTFGTGNATPGSVILSSVTLAANSSIGGTGDTTIGAVISETGGSQSLTKVGAGTLTLNGTNTYSGDTTVSGGALSLGAINASNDLSTVTIGTSATMALTFAGTDTVDKLFIGATQQPAGIYGHTSTGATNGGQGVGALDARFAAGTGTLTVTAGPSAGNTYLDWLALNAPATGFDTDTDKDGVPNGVENVLGSNPNTFSPGLTEVSATGSSTTFKHLLNPTIGSDVTYSYQWSTDLTEWKASGESNTGGTTATVVASPPASGVVTVVITITGGPSAKVFGRLVAHQ